MHPHALEEAEGDHQPRNREKHHLTSALLGNEIDALVQEQLRSLPLSKMNILVYIDHISSANCNSALIAVTLDDEKGKDAIERDEANEPAQPYRNWRWRSRCDGIQALALPSRAIDYDI
jgi:4-alpha-glucanotransferase